jgi:hypothetical protein
MVGVFWEQQGAGEARIRRSGDCALGGGGGAVGRVWTLQVIFHSDGTKKSLLNVLRRVEVSSPEP